jgi:hypothetical protein
MGALEGLLVRRLMSSVFLEGETGWGGGEEVTPAGMEIPTIEEVGRAFLVGVAVADEDSAGRSREAQDFLGAAAGAGTGAGVEEDVEVDAEGSGMGSGAGAASTFGVETCDAGTAAGVGVEVTSWSFEDKSVDSTAEATEG